MARKIPLRPILEALLQRVRSSASSFSTPLVLAQAGTLSLIPRTATELQQRLPAVVGTIADLAGQNSENSVGRYEGTLQVDLHLLVKAPETGNLVNNFLDDQELLLELFSGYESGDPISLSGGLQVEIEECLPTGLTQHPELQEMLEEPLPIEWATARITVRFHSWEQ